MATKSNCTSNPSPNRSTDNPSSPQDEAQKKTPNAFTPEFLEKLHEREDAPLAALEAEMRGPWKVVEIAVEGADRSSLDIERWAVIRAWEDPMVDPPAGTFRFREIALIYAAALRNVEALLRSSEALAQLLEAGCGPVAELLGRRLMAVE
jgi:hypothetical protein